MELFIGFDYWPCLHSSTASSGTVGFHDFNVSFSMRPKKQHLKIFQNERFLEGSFGTIFSTETSAWQLA